MRKKQIQILLVLLVIASLVMIFNIWLDKQNLAKKTVYGVTFCQGYAKALGFNPHKLYQQMFQDLKVKNIRLSAYWDEIEQNPDEFDFTDLDFYINEATENNAQIILSIGYKLPRWPECHTPNWLKTADQSTRQKRQLMMLSEVIKHYEKNSTIVAWQVENEPLLQFGTCPEPDPVFLQEEVKFVKSKTQKPIILTDSGELSTWTTPMQLGDYFGTTLYRIVHNDLIGAFPYPLQPWFYRTKAFLVKKLFAQNNQKIMLVELQTEPWAYIFIGDIPVKEQIDQFKVADFAKNILFARKVGFSENYLWGVEWWYWMKANGHPEYLEYAKTLF